MRNCISSDFLEIIGDFGIKKLTAGKIKSRRYLEYHRSRLFFDLCHSYFNNFSYLLQRTKLIVASFFGVWFSETIKDCVHMTNMTVMAVYGETLKNLFSQKHGIETAFYKTHFGFIYYQFCSDDMIRD